MPTREKVIKKLLPYYVVETVQMVKSVKVFEFLASASSEQHYIEFSNNIRGHSKTTLTIFCPILTTYLPPVDMFTK